LALRLAWLGLAAVLVLSLAPFVLDSHLTKFAPQRSGAAAWLAKIGLLLAMALAIALSAWAGRRSERHAFLLTAVFVLLSAGMTAYHWYVVDQGWFEVQEGTQVVRYYHINWQRALYAAVLNHKPATHGEVWIPHIYRPLPYGFTRALERWLGDWTLACLSYRFFFTYWFIWACYHFARAFLPTKPALLTLAVLAVLYPLSVQYYMGQLTDPMSHAFFVLGLIAIIKDRWISLAALLTLGILAKETAVVLVPAYLVCAWCTGVPAFLRTALLGAIAVATFLAVRLPFGWAGDTYSLNGSQLMIEQNLGFGSPDLASSAPLYQNLFHPLLFIGIFLPLILKYWRTTDVRLKALFLTVTPLIFLSSLCFSWLYESRNYLPLLPLLTTMAQGPGRPIRRAN
jgi:hypothetical protein